MIRNKSGNSLNFISYKDYRNYLYHPSDEGCSLKGNFAKEGYSEGSQRQYLTCDIKRKSSAYLDEHKRDHYRVGQILHQKVYNKTTGCIVENGRPLSYMIRPQQDQVGRFTSAVQLRTKNSLSRNQIHSRTDLDHVLKTPQQHLSSSKKKEKLRNRRFCYGIQKSSSPKVFERSFKVMQQPLSHSTNNYQSVKRIERKDLRLFSNLNNIPSSVSDSPTTKQRTDRFLIGVHHGNISKEGKCLLESQRGKSNRSKRSMNKQILIEDEVRENSIEERTEQIRKKYKHQSLNTLSPEVQVFAITEPHSKTKSKFSNTQYASYSHHEDILNQNLATESILVNEFQTDIQNHQKKRDALEEVCLNKKDTKVKQNKERGSVTSATSLLRKLSKGSFSKFNVNKFSTKSGIQVKNPSSSNKSLLKTGKGKKGSNENKINKYKLISNFKPYPKTETYTSRSNYELDKLSQKLDRYISSHIGSQKGQVTSKTHNAAKMLDETLCEKKLRVARRLNRF